MIAFDYVPCRNGSSRLIGRGNSCVCLSDEHDSFTISSPCEQWWICIGSIFVGSTCLEEIKSGPIFYKMRLLEVRLCHLGVVSRSMQAGSMSCNQIVVCGVIQKVHSTRFLLRRFIRGETIQQSPGDADRPEQAVRSGVPYR